MRMCIVQKVNYERRRESVLVQLLISYCPIHQQIIVDKLTISQDPRTEAVVAERLRRLTRNQIPAGSVGSNPTNCELILRKGNERGSKNSR